MSRFKIASQLIMIINIHMTKEIVKTAVRAFPPSDPGKRLVSAGEG
jgi:hypothetical protein